MARYFLDTGPVIGVTFLHDLWRSESETVFESDNTFYTSKVAVYEYCNRTDSNSAETADVDWESEKGRFGEKLSKIRAAQFNLDTKLQSFDDDDLDFETLVDLFISEARIKEDVYPTELVEEHIRPNIEEYLLDEIDGQEITQKVARKAMDGLCDTIQTEARDTKSQLREIVHLAPRHDGDWSQEREQLDFAGNRDRLILCDAANLKRKQQLKKVITVDGSDMYDNRKRVEAILGLKILLVKDDVADHSSFLGDEEESRQVS